MLMRKSSRPTWISCFILLITSDNSNQQAILGNHHGILCNWYSSFKELLDSTPPPQKKSRYTQNSQIWKEIPFKTIIFGIQKITESIFVAPSRVLKSRPRPTPNGTAQTILSSNQCKHLQLPQSSIDVTAMPAIRAGRSQSCTVDGQNPAPLGMNEILS